MLAEPGSRRVQIVGPKRGDLRLRVSAVIIAVQILGQTVLGFKVSVAQILVSIGVCALIDATASMWQHRLLAWPASGLLTGNSVAFILRASGTQHGDWWSLHGIQYFAFAALVSMVSKYLIRPGGRHLFNPSNIGLVACLLVFGPRRVFPQYLWWGPISVRVVAAYVVILVGAVWILRPLRMMPMAATCFATFGVLVAALAVSGRTFFAIWHPDPIAGVTYWLNICASPELLIFVFFMISDPQTAPRDQRGRIVYGFAIAVVACALLSTQPTEFGVKLGILASLTAVCAFVPFIERRSTTSRVAMAASAIVVALVLVGTSALTDNREVRNIERGISSSRQ